MRSHGHSLCLCLTVTLFTTVYLKQVLEPYSVQHYFFHESRNNSCGPLTLAYSLAILPDPQATSSRGCKTEPLRGWPFLLYPVRVRVGGYFWALRSGVAGNRCRCCCQHCRQLVERPQLRHGCAKQTRIIVIRFLTPEREGGVERKIEILRLMMNMHGRIV